MYTRIFSVAAFLLLLAGNVYARGKRSKKSPNADKLSKIERDGEKHENNGDENGKNGEKDAAEALDEKTGFTTIKNAPLSCLTRARSTRFLHGLKNRISAVILYGKITLQVFILQSSRKI